MPIECTRNGNNQSVHLQIQGPFNYEIADDLQSSYQVTPLPREFIIDLRHAEHIDSSALGMLLNMRKNLPDEVAIRIANCRPAVRKILTIARFDKKFVIE